MEEQTELERRLRQSLASQVGQARPSRADMPGRAIRAARRRKAARGATGAVAVVAATVLAGGAFQQVWAPEPPPRPTIGFAYVDQPPPEPFSTPASPSPEPPPQLDAPAGVVASTADGRLALAVDGDNAINLRYLGHVVSVHQVADGWAVVTGRDSGVALWWVTEQQQRPELVLGNLDAVAVDHSRLAWRRGSLLSAAYLSASGELEHQVDSELPPPPADSPAAAEVDQPARIDPVGFVGERVLLVHRSPDDDTIGWASWQPTGGPLPQQWATNVMTVFGALPGGDAAIGLALVSGQPCLVQLTVDDDLAVERSACLPQPLLADQPGALSPDGRWLLASAADDSGRPALVLVDVAASLAGADGQIEWVPGPMTTGQPVWPDSETVRYPVEGGLAELDPERMITDGEDAVGTRSFPGEPVVVGRVI